MNKYIYGPFVIGSSLPLPLFSTDREVTIDIEITHHPIDASIEPITEILNDGMTVHTSIYDEFHGTVCNGSHISIFHNSTSVLSRVSLGILNKLLPIALIQKGLIVFHASAILKDNSVILFLAPPGSGKSTIAAHCAMSGHASFFADDFVPVILKEESFLALPGSPSVRLTNDSKDFFRLDTEIDIADKSI